ncbi:MAG: GNAT family N-acetyltransferase [Erysipelotrichaceae bacterium]
MITQPNSYQLQELKKLIVGSSPNAKTELIEYNLEHPKTDDQYLVIEQDDQIISTLGISYFDINYSKRIIKTGYIHSLVTKIDYRERGHANSLIREAINELENKCLFTYTSTYHPELFEKYDFKMIYYYKTYSIEKGYLNNISKAGIDTNLNEQELLKIYEKYTSHFEGYIKRKQTYFNTILKYVNEGLLDIVGYRDNKGMLLGYALYHIYNDKPIIKEIIYLNSLALIKLCSYLIGDNNELIINVSLAECLDKVFPLILPKKVPYMMVRINNYELLSKLIGKVVTTPTEVFNLLNKPLYINI